MKGRILSVAALLIVALGCSNAARADFLYGVKAGPMLISFDDVDVSDDPLNAGLLIGYEFGVLFGDLAIEAEITRTVTAGSVSGIDLEVESQGAYVSFTTAGPIYGKLRAGVMKASIDASGLSEDENGETYGVGAGISLGLFRVELEYTVVDDDVQFVSLGVIF